MDKVLLIVILILVWYLILSILTFVFRSMYRRTYDHKYITFANTANLLTVINPVTNFIESITEYPLTRRITLLRNPRF